MNETTNKIKASQVIMTIAAFVIVVAGMRAATDIIVPFLLAAFIAIISAPPLFWMERKGLPVWLALLIVIFGVLSIILVIAGLVGSSVADFSRDLPLYQSKLKVQTVRIFTWLNSLGIDISSLELSKNLDPGMAMKLVATTLNSLRDVLTNGFLILITVIFILMEASSFPVKLHSIIGDHKNSLAHFDTFLNNVKQYMAIKTLVSLGTGIFIAGWLAVIGVDYPLLWGLLAFVLNYIPNIGSIIAAFPAVILATVQLGFTWAIGAAAGYVLVNVLMGNMIEPRLLGRGLGLSTLVVFLSLIFWGWVLGPVGMLLSVPLTITVKIALDSNEDTRWLAILLGPEITPEGGAKKKKLIKKG